MQKFKYLLDLSHFTFNLDFLADSQRCPLCVNQFGLSSSQGESEMHGLGLLLILNLFILQVSGRQLKLLNSLMVKI